MHLYTLKHKHTCSYTHIQSLPQTIRLPGLAPSHLHITGLILCRSPAHRLRSSFKPARSLQGSGFGRHQLPPCPLNQFADLSRNITSSEDPASRSPWSRLGAGVCACSCLALIACWLCSSWAQHRAQCWGLNARREERDLKGGPVLHVCQLLANEAHLRSRAHHCCEWHRFRF